MKDILRVFVAALALALGSDALAGVLASGTGWTLTDDGTLTVTKDYVWTDQSNTQGWYENKSDIKNVIVGDGVTKIGYNAFYGYATIESLSLPDGLIEICGGAFYGCAKLKELILPESLTRIAGFGNCTGLTSVTLPKNVNVIYDYTFRGCTGLKTVISLSGSKPISFGSDAFPRNQCTLYLPDDIVDYYWVAQTWGKLFSDIRPLSSMPTSIKELNGGEAKISVSAGMVTVEGADKVEVYDLTGRKMTTSSPLPAGAYVVSTSKGSARIIVK